MVGKLHLRTPSDTKSKSSFLIGELTVGSTRGLLTNSHARDYLNVMSILDSIKV